MPLVNSLKNKTIVLLLLLACFIGLYGETMLSLAGRWSTADNPTYSHGPLLLMVAIYFFYKTWSNSEFNFALRHHWIKLTLLSAFSLLWAVSALVSVQIVQYLMLIFLFILALSALFNFKCNSRIYFPALLMLSAVPVWDFFTVYLQHAATPVVVLLLKATFIPVFREGFFIEIPEGTFEVRNSCSGLNQFIVGVTVTLIYCYMHNIPLMRSLRYALYALLLAIASNIVRIYIVVIAGHLTNMQHYFITGEHVSIGWVVFAVMYGGFLYLLMRRDRKIMPEAEQQAATVSAQADARDSQRKLAIILPVFITIVIGPLLLNIYKPFLEGYQGERVILPEKIQNWTASENALDRPRPSFPPATYETFKKYISDNDKTIYLFLAQYQQQTQEAEAINNNNKIYNQEQFKRLIHNRKLKIHDYTVRELLVEEKSGERWLIWSWYSVLGQQLSNDYLAKLYNLLGMLGLDPEVKVFIISTREDRPLDELRAELTKFVMK